jgi:hypothetical protein
MDRRERPQKLSCHAKDTARLAIGLFSDYIREGAQIAQRKEKQESRRKTFLRRKSRLSIFQKVAEYNPSLSESSTKERVTSPTLFVLKVPFEVPHDCGTALFIIGMYI